MIDANHAYNATSATRMGRRVQSNEILWFEEPVTPEDHAGYQQVRRSLDIPIAGGECEFTRYGFRDLIEDCVDIVQLDLCCAGGFTEWQKISALASIFSKPVLPHVWGSGIAVAAALQAIATDGTSGCFAKRTHDRIRSHTQSYPRRPPATAISPRKRIPGGAGWARPWRRN